MISQRAPKGKAETPNALSVGLLAVDSISKFPSSRLGRDVRDDQSDLPKICRREMRPRPRFMASPTTRGGGSSCRPQAQVSRPARRRPHNSASRGGAPRACRGHACDCDRRRGAGSPKGVYWLLDQMERRIKPSRCAPVLSTPSDTRRTKACALQFFSEDVEVAPSETARHGRS